MLRPTLLGTSLLAALVACSEAHDVVVPVDGGADAAAATLGGMDASAAPRIDARNCRPDADFLLGGGRRVGACQGECSFELALSSVITLGDGQCVGYSASLRVFDAASGLLYVANGELSQAAWNRAASLGAALRSQQLELTYGCPECARGAAWVQTEPVDAEPRQHSYDLGGAPPPLVAVDAFIQGLIDQLRSCRGPELVHCTRTP